MAQVVNALQSFLRLKNVITCVLASLLLIISIDTTRRLSAAKSIDEKNKNMKTPGIVCVVLGVVFFILSIIGMVLGQPYIRTATTFDPTGTVNSFIRSIFFFDIALITIGSIIISAVNSSKTPEEKNAKLARLSSFLMFFSSFLLGYSLKSLRG